jgi:plasmid replication initiation protein
VKYLKKVLGLLKEFKRFDMEEIMDILSLISFAQKRIREEKNDDGKLSVAEIVEVIGDIAEHENVPEEYKDEAVVIATIAALIEEYFGGDED